MTRGTLVSRRNLPFIIQSDTPRCKESNRLKYWAASHLNQQRPKFNAALHFHSPLMTKPFAKRNHRRRSHLQIDADTFNMPKPIRWPIRLNRLIIYDVVDSSSSLVWVCWNIQNSLSVSSFMRWNVATSLTRRPAKPTKCKNFLHFYDSVKEGKLEMKIFLSASNGCEYFLTDMHANHLRVSAGMTGLLTVGMQMSSNLDPEC